MPDYNKNLKKFISGLGGKNYWSTPVRQESDRQTAVTENRVKEEMSWRDYSMNTYGLGPYKHGKDFSDSMDMTGLGTSSKKRFGEWFTDPETIKRVKDQTGMSYDQLMGHVMTGLGSRIQKGNSGIGNAMYDVDSHSITTSTDNESIMSHELVHASGIDDILGNELLGIMGISEDEIDKAKAVNLNDYPDNLKGRSRAIHQYLRKPGEAYGNFFEFRDALGLKPGEKVDEKKLDVLLKKSDNASESTFWRHFGSGKKKEIINALNTMASKSDIEKYKGLT